MMSNAMIPEILNGLYKGYKVFKDINGDWYLVYPKKNIKVPCFYWDIEKVAGMPFIVMTDNELYYTGE